MEETQILKLDGEGPFGAQPGTEPSAALTSFGEAVLPQKNALQEHPSSSSVVRTYASQLYAQFESISNVDYYPEIVTLEPSSCLRIGNRAWN